ncbi:hypothetical protein PMIN04_008904 [Paraphaeosphaeria minitans]
MTANATSPVIIRPAFPTPSEESTPNISNPSTPATSPPQSPTGTCFPAVAASQPAYSWAKSYLKSSLPKSKTNRLRGEQKQWQHTPSTTIQIPPWYTTERTRIPPLSLRIPRSSYTPQNRSYHDQQGQNKAPGALCLMPNASPYPRG